MKEPVAFKGVKNHLEVSISPNIEFDYAKKYIINKLNSGRNFFSSTNHMKILGKLTIDQQLELKNILQSEYKIENIEFAQLDIKFMPASFFRNNIPANIFGKKLLDQDVQRKKTTLASVIKAPRKREATGNEKNSVSLFEPPLDLNSGVGHVRESKALMVSETVRNGQRLTYDGDIVVFGDVNSGAEIIATGNIAVIGFLRGTAHAGASGDETAVVAASRLEPQQLRIGVHIAIAPENTKKVAINYPEIARVLASGKISIDPLSSSSNKNIKSLIK